MIKTIYVLIMPIPTFEALKITKPGRESAHLNDDYWNIVDACWNKITESFPKSHGSLQPLLTKIDRREFDSSYDLIYGQVQSGKSRAMMMLMWYSVFIKTDIIPAVLTIKLSSVRDDFIGKMSSKGELNSIVESVILDQFPKFKPLISIFQLKGIDLQSLKKTRSSRLSHNEIPVLLQQPHNLKQLVEFYHQTCKDNRKSLLVLIDEIHGMYTDPFKTRILGLNSSKIVNQSMMYWLHQKAQAKKIALVGITATPARAISDPHLFPAQLHTLTSDPVREMTYFGKLSELTERQFDLDPALYHSQGFIPVTTGPDGQDLVAMLKQIVDRPHVVLNDGAKLVKMVLITVDRYTDYHLDTASELLESTPNLVIKIVNSSKTDTGDKQDLESIFKEVASMSASSGELAEKLARGALVIIGLGCFSAGVSVRPPPGMKIEFSFDQTSYQVGFLTDQIYRATKPLSASERKQATSTLTLTQSRFLETNIQAMRLFGYYPVQACPTLWLFGDSITEVRCQKKLLQSQLNTNHSLPGQYREKPSSVSSYMTTQPYELFKASPYTKSRSNINYKIQHLNHSPTPFDLQLDNNDSINSGGNSINSDGNSINSAGDSINSGDDSINSGDVPPLHVAGVQKGGGAPLVYYHETEIYPIGQWLTEAGIVREYQEQYVPWSTISDFHERRSGPNWEVGMPRKSDANEFRAKIQRVARERGVEINQLFQIPYTGDRYNVLLSVCVHPRNGNTWQVRSLLSGPSGPETRLEDTVLVVFKHPILQGDDRDRPEMTYYFKECDDRYVVIYPHRDANQDKNINIYTHKYLDKYNYDPQHYTCVDTMDSAILRAMASGGPAKNGWILFMWYYRYRFGKTDVQEYANAWRLYPDKEFFRQSARRGSTLQDVLDRLNPNIGNDAASLDQEIEIEIRSERETESYQDQEIEIDIDIESDRFFDQYNYEIEIEDVDADRHRTVIYN